MLVSSGIIVTARFIQAFNRARHWNTELEQRFDEARRDLTASFQRMRSLEAEQVLSQERERMMREVHDGLGAQLISTLAMVELGTAQKDELREALRGALDEIRIVIDSLDPLVDDIPTLLGMLRGRLQPRMERRGVILRWHVDDLPRIESHGPREFLHILRIVQEAFSNSIRHSGARTLALSARVKQTEIGAAICIEVSDDGSGLAAPRGQGAV